MFCELEIKNGVQSEGGFGRQFGVGGSKHLLPAKHWGDERLLFEIFEQMGDDGEPLVILPTALR